ALAVLSRKIELAAAGDATFLVVVFDRKLGPAADQLASGWIARRRQRNDQPDGDRLGGGVERAPHATARARWRARRGQRPRSRPGNPPQPSPKSPTAASL